MRRIASPALSANILIEPAIAIGNDVETGDLLLAQVSGERIHVLFPETASNHCIQKRPRAKVFCVPTGTRQRTGYRCRKNLVETRFVHDAPLYFARRRLIL